MSSDTLNLPAAAGRGKVKRVRISRTVRAKLLLSPARMEQRLRARRTSTRIGSDVPIFLAGAIENIIRDVVQGAVDNVAKRKRARIEPEDLARSIDGDKELLDIFPHVTVAGGGLREGAKRRFPERKPRKVSLKKE
jgi:histone H3/H4